jgi:hypothetical protein
MQKDQNKFIFALIKFKKILFSKNKLKIRNTKKTAKNTLKLSDLNLKK